MRLIKSILRWLSALILHLSIFGLISSIVFSLFLSNPQNLKDVLIESGIYNNFVPAFINENVSRDNGQDSLPLSDPEIQQSAIEAFSPLSLKNATEGVVDSFYSWLDGGNNNLEFSVDFNLQKDIFIDLVSTYGANRLAELPICGESDVSSVRIFELQCRPENVGLSFVKQRLTEDLQASELFNDMTITQEDLPETDAGVLIYKRFSFAPTIYQVAKNGVWIFGVATLCTSALFIFIRKPYRNGFRLYGRDLLSNGITLLIMTFVFGFILPRYTNSFDIAGSEITNLMNSVLDTFFRRLDVIIINITLQIIAFAILILAIERLSRRNSKYQNLEQRSGMSSGYAKKQKPVVVFSKNPPIQTSEVKKKINKTARSAKKYRKIQL